MFTFVQNKVLQLSSAVTALGISALFIYCFFIINFFPSELSIGETLLFLFAGLGFGLLYSLIVLVFYFSVAQVISTWKNKTFFSDILINIIAIFFLFFPLVFLFFTSSTIESWLTLVSFYASGFILNIESLSESKQLIFINGDISQEEKEREKRRVMFLAVGILTPLLMSKVTS